MGEHGTIGTLLSSFLFFFPAAFVALRRRLWVRWLGFLAAGTLMIWYHSCRDHDSCVATETERRADHAVALFVSISTILLYGHFRFQLVESLLLLCIAAACSLFVAYDLEDSRLYTSMFVLGTSLPIVGVTWAIRRWPPVRVPWIITGTVFLLVAGVLYLVDQSSLWIHSAIHATGAIGCALVCYAARDPSLQQDYHLVPDLQFS